MSGARKTRYNQENDRMVLTVLSQLCNPLAENMSHQTRGVDHHAHKDHRRPMSIQLSSLVKIWSHSMLSLHKNRLILVPALKHRAPTEQFINIANCEQCLRAQLLSSVLEQSGTITLIGGTWKWHTIFFERKNVTLHSACFFVSKDPLPAFIDKRRAIYKAVQAQATPTFVRGFTIKWRPRHPYSTRDRFTWILQQLKEHHLC